jgi:L-fuconolactonase
VRIDSHQHFLDPARFDYRAFDFVPERAYLPQQLHTILRRNRFEGSVVIQAATDATETRWLLELASEYPFVLGVVGWADLSDARLGHLLDEYQQHRKFKGIRQRVSSEDWLNREDVRRGLQELVRRGLTFDLLIQPEHLNMLPRLAERIPDLRITIDHMAQPWTCVQGFDTWARGMEAASLPDGVFCKVSGLLSASGWKASQLAPYVAHAMHAFGPDRLMFGSDWPARAGIWKESLAAFTQACGPLPVPTRETLLGGTAQRFYHLEPLVL